MSRFKLAIVAAITLAIVLVATFYWYSSSSLESQIDRLRAAGEPVRPADLARDPIPDAQNAWTHFSSSKREIGSIEKATYAIVKDDYRGTNRSAADVERLSVVLADHADGLAAIDRGLACGDFDAHFNYDLDGMAFLAQPRDDLSTLRAIARIQALRASVLAAHGDYDAAAAAALSIDRLAQFAEREPLNIGYLVACALRGLSVALLEAIIAQETLSSDSRAAIKRQLAAADAMRPFVESLRGERAVGLDTFKAMQSMNGGVMRLAWWLKWDCRDYLERMQHQIELGAAPYYETAQRMADFDAANSPYGMLTQLGVESIDMARVAMDRARAQMRCLRVLNALYGGMHDPAGAAPAIDALGLPAEATIDPFTGKPLVIKSDGQRWIVYSLGPDHVDDGGDFKLRPAPKAQHQASTRAIPWFGDVGVGSAPEKSTTSATSDAPIVAP